MRSWDLLMAEFNLLRREGVVVAVLVGFLVTVVAAGFVGRVSIDDRRATADAALQEYRQLVESLANQAAAGSDTARSAGAVAFSVLSVPVVKAQTALEALAIGQGDLLADTYFVTARGAYHFLTRTDPDNALRFTVGSFDVAFLLIWVLPLLVVGVVFDVVVGERERGVLALPLRLAQMVRARACAERVLLDIDRAGGGRRRDLLDGDNGLGDHGMVAGRHGVPAVLGGVGAVDQSAREHYGIRRNAVRRRMACACRADTGLDQCRCKQRRTAAVAS